MPFVPAPESVVGSKYRLVRRLASGGMGSVWLARHLSLDADVAVKLMSPLVAETPTARSRFEREAKASAQLKSKHIVKVQDYGVEADTPYLVMELLEGEDLGERLARVGRMSLAALAPIFTEICKGLKVAHDAGIVHRDLKPSNVFLAREGDEEIVKLCDFGVARETKSKLVDDKTSSGVVVGSPHHMSPEQAHGGAIDHRSDLWSLGVLVFRALTGKKPFDGEALATVMLAVVTQPIPRATAIVSDLPPDVDRFVARALCRDVDGRFQSATAMADALRAIAAGDDASQLLGPPVVAEKIGREEATLPAAPASSPAGDPASVDTPRTEGTPSREIRAFTAGVASARLPRSRLVRVVPWAALAVAVGTAGFFLGRSGPPGAPEAAAPASSDAAPRAPSGGETAAISVMPVTEVSASAGTTGALASAAASAPASASSAAPARTAGVRGARPPAARGVRIDEFTGLPTP